MSEIARRITVKQLARRIKNRLVKENLNPQHLKALADSGRSIVAIYWSNCSLEEKARLRRSLKNLLRMGITPDIILNEVGRQMPELAPIIFSEAFRKAELQRLDEFLKG